jgi:hypothetical protein
MVWISPDSGADYATLPIGKIGVNAARAACGPRRKADFSGKENAPLE